jgi:hypothetical protein
MQINVKITKYFTYCCIIGNLLLFFPSLSIVVTGAVASAETYFLLFSEDSDHLHLYWKTVFLSVLVVYVLFYLCLFIYYTGYLFRSVNNICKESQHLDSSNISLLKRTKVLIVADLLNATFIVFVLVLLAYRRG